MSFNVNNKTNWLTDAKCHLFNEEYLNTIMNNSLIKSPSWDWDYDSDLNGFRTQVDLPGCRRENITIDLDFVNGKVIINSFRTLNNSEVKINKTLVTPKDTDMSKLKATLADGVLTLVVPKITPQNLKLKRVSIE
jgi:HSP20 family molecular chaperone IbpA